MEQKRELTMEEMDKVSGGNGGDRWGRNPEFIDCPTCGQPVNPNVLKSSHDYSCPHCGNTIPESDL